MVFSLYTDDRLTFGSRVMSDLMLGTGFSHNPGELTGTVAFLVALEEVVEITNRVGCTRIQYLGQGCTTDSAYLTW